MDRRDFCRTTTASAAGMLIGCGAQHTHANKNVISALVRQHDKKVPDLLQRQEADHRHRWFGGVRDTWGIHTPGGTAHFFRTLTCCMLSPGSRYFQSSHIAERLYNAIVYLRNAQHSDGTIDLLSTNFHSTPDTAFVMEWMCGCYGLLSKMGESGYGELLARLREFLLSAGDALTVGGIHTPNHRWVVCMALARLNSLLPNEKYVHRIDEWLGEHIDIDDDGQFTEKSTSIYSPLTDRCLITIARLLDRPELYEPVRKNLDMTLYYIHPNGEVVTEASKRQDRYKFGHMSPYYYPYRFMAQLDGDGRFAAMARWIERTSLPRLDAVLMYLLESPKLCSDMPADSLLPRDYAKIFCASNLARIRRGDISATILAKNHTFFSFRKGTAVLQALRIATAFFGKGQFEADKLTFEDGVYVLRQELEGPYYQPFPKDRIPEDGDWEKMKRDERPKSEIQRLCYEVRLSEQNGAFDIDIRIEGTENVPTAIELAFKHGGRLTGVSKISGIKDGWFLKEGIGRYIFEGKTIQFGPGKHSHRWTELRGAEKKLDAQSIFLTGFTPLRWRLHIY